MRKKSTTAFATIAALALASGLPDLSEALAPETGFVFSKEEQEKKKTRAAQKRARRAARNKRLEHPND